MAVTIRPWADADLAEFAPIFRAIVDDGETYAYPADLTDDQIRALWVPGPPDAAVVAVHDGRIVGSAKMGPNRPARGSHVGTASFMVSPDARGLGVGRALAEHVVAWHEEHGFAAIQFNAVVETNTAAVALWRSLGFEIIGTVPETFESARHGRVGLHVMHKRLGS